jgi:HD-GYP domain-containing protein (c-di-GMP phosphodiesterase class II)
MAKDNASRSAGAMGELKGLKAHLTELGLGYSLWDAQAFSVGPASLGSNFCHAVSRCGGSCSQASSDIARRVIATGVPVRSMATFGCCLMGVPIYQRRRLVGALVVEYPTSQMMQEPVLRNLCQSLAMDYDSLHQLAAKACLHSDHEGESLLKIIGWLLEQEQGIAVSTNEIATLSDNLADTYEELSLVYRISGAMKVTLQPGEFLQNVVNELAEVMNIDGAVALVHGHGTAADEDSVVFAGSVDLNADQIKLLASTYISPRFEGHGRAVLDNDFHADDSSGLGLAIHNMIAAPLAADKTPIGMLIGINGREGDFDSVDLKLISSIASQAAIYLANHRLYADLQDLLMGVLHALTASIDAKDPYTCGHSQRVAMISRRLAEACGFAPKKVKQIYLMGLLHDIGKIGVPEAVLCKTGRLTEEEFEAIKKHPTVGAKILGGIRQLDDVVVGILTHHERLDGKGYPRKLPAADIPIEGRIVCLADCFDAMTSNRTYRSALPLETAIAELRKCAGTQFDADLVEKFLAMDLTKFLDELRGSASQGVAFGDVAWTDNSANPEVEVAEVAVQVPIEGKS